MLKKPLVIAAFAIIFLLCQGVAYFMTIQSLGTWCNEKYGIGFFGASPVFLLVEWGILGALLVLSAQRTRGWAERSIFSIILAGGLSNALERVIYGCVHDYWTMPLIGSHVNIADIVITAGVGGLLWIFLKQKE